ncbi:MAG: DUF1573 domain-containing protein [Muribaculaceae bacterium]|nr:DUF1573 domain-containing protein [Muribaculaceae bacterium]
MKKILSAILISAAATAAYASESVRWLETNHNFGAFDENMGRVSTVFRFVNTGTEPVSIVAARASCGCTAPDYDRAPVAPGDTATVTVTYDPAGRPGRFSKYVAVDFSYEGSRQKLTIEGTVVGNSASVAQQYPAECTSMLRLSRGAAMMGDVVKGQLKTLFLKAYNSSHDTIAPSVSNLPKYVSVTVAPERVAPGEQCSFIFYFRSDRCPLYGLVSDTVYVSPDPLSSTICPLPLTALVNEDFTKLSPKQLAKAPAIRIENSSADFGDLDAGEPAVERTVEIANTGKSSLEIRRVYTATPGVSAAIDRSSLKPGKKAVITIKVKPAELTGALLNARISVITNDPTQPIATVRAVGTIRR